MSLICILLVGQTIASGIQTKTRLKSVWHSEMLSKNEEICLSKNEFSQTKIPGPSVFGFLGFEDPNLIFSLMRLGKIRASELNMILGVLCWLYKV